MILLLTLPFVPQETSLADRFHPFLEGRVRGESTFDQPSGEDRHRGRLRLRVGSTFDIAPGLTGEVRLSTASDGRDANNPHWDFGDGGDAFQGGDVVLDRIYVGWQALETVELRAGKMPHQFARMPGYNELVWDADIQPSGVSAAWSPCLDKCPYDLTFRVVEYIAVENSSAADSTMFGLEGSGGYDLTSTTKVKGSVAYMDWSSLSAGASVFGNQGNTDVTGDFGILDSHVALAVETDGVGTVEGGVEYMNNVKESSDDQGFSIGVKVGHSNRKGAVNVFACYYDLDANSVFSPVAQDDTPIAGTGLGTPTSKGMSGVIGGVQWFFADNASLKLWALTSNVDDSSDPYRIRLDLDFTMK